MNLHIEHRTSNVEHRIKKTLNGERLGRKEEFAISSLYLYSSFDVGRSMLDVQKPTAGKMLFA